MILSDTTTVRLWPIPRMFQLFFILIVTATLGVTAWSLIAPALETSTGCDNITYESLCARVDGGIAQDYASMVQKVSIDYDVLIGVVIAPLIIGIAVAVATPGRTSLGRVWYGAVFVALAMLIWFGVKIFYNAQNSMTGVLSADEPFLSEPTLVSVAAITIYAMVDARWQRRRYVWLRAWSLLFFEVALLAVLGYSTLDPMQASATLVLGAFMGVIVILLMVSFLAFWRRTFHVAAKFTGLLLVLSLLGGYLVSMAEQTYYSFEYSWIAAVLGVIFTYGLGAWMISRRPIPLVN